MIVIYTNLASSQTQSLPKSKEMQTFVELFMCALNRLGIGSHDIEHVKKARGARPFTAQWRYVQHQVTLVQLDCRRCDTKEMDSSATSLKCTNHVIQNCFNNIKMLLKKFTLHFAPSIFSPFDAHPSTLDLLV